MAELAKGLGENHSTVKSKLATVYGTHDFTRANPAPGQSVTIHPDGTITIVSQANTNTNVAK